MSPYLLNWRTDAVVLELTDEGQEASCHSVPNEVDEPIIVGEVAEDALRLAEI